MIWASLITEPLEVIRRWPHRALVTTCGGQDASHAGAASFPVMAIVTASHGCGPLRALHALLVATLDALLGAVSGDIGWHLIITTRGHLPACLCGAEHDCLIASGVLGGNAVWLLEHAYEDVALSALPWALLTVSERHAWATLVSLAVNLRLIAPSLSSPQWSLG
jgi:hypothetical protein